MVPATVDNWLFVNMHTPISIMAGDDEATVETKMAGRHP